MTNTNTDSALQEEVSHLAEQLFDNEIKKQANFINKLLDICSRAQGKDFLLIHNPGGLGNKTLEHCHQWERSIVDGISATLERLGHSQLLIQHFRAESGWWEHIRYIKELFRVSTVKVNILATQLEFIIRHISNLKVILIGVSQGAAFGNAVMQQLGEPRQVYSIELGMFFSHMSRRVVTERTLAIDGNGVMPDAMMEWNIPAIIRAYFIIAPFRWIKYRLEGKAIRFFDCANVRGHDYSWGYPEVQQRITDFLATNFGTKSKLEGGQS